MRTGSAFDKAPVLFPAGLGDASTDAVQVVPVIEESSGSKVDDLAIFLSIVSSLALVVSTFRK